MSGFSKTYAVVVRDKTFHLSREQLIFEPGNFFEQSYLIKSPTSGLGNNNVIRVDRHAGCFTIIYDYLSGYDVFPLSEEECTKAGLDRDRLLRFLAADAIAYNMPSFGDKVKKEMIRLRAEELRAEKHKAEHDAESAKLALETAKVKAEAERQNLKDRLEHDLKVLEVQHEHAKYFKRLEILMERSRAIKDVEITSLVNSPAHVNSPLITSPGPKFPNQMLLFDTISNGIEEMLSMSPGSLGRARPGASASGNTYASPGGHSVQSARTH